MISSRLYYCDRARLLLIIQVVIQVVLVLVIVLSVPAMKLREVSKSKLNTVLHYKKLYKLDVRCRGAASSTIPPKRIAVQVVGGNYLAHYCSRW